MLTFFFALAVFASAFERPVAGGCGQSLDLEHAYILQAHVRDTGHCCPLCSKSSSPFQFSLKRVLFCSTDNKMLYNGFRAFTTRISSAVSKCDMHFFAAFEVRVWHEPKYPRAAALLRMRVGRLGSGRWRMPVKRYTGDVCDETRVVRGRTCTWIIQNEL